MFNQTKSDAANPQSGYSDADDGLDRRWLLVALAMLVVIFWR